jgi:tetratricopeptide (TPR) repeat protein
LRLKICFGVAAALGCYLAAGPGVHAQAPAQNPAQGQAQTNSGQKQQAPAAAPQGGASNPFPTDESTIPVMPSKDTPDLPRGTAGDNGTTSATLPGGDVDPVRSPDDSGSGSSAGFSSSSSGVDSLMPGPDDEQPTADRPGKRGRKQQDDVAPEHHESAAEDENVGKYYLDNKDWRAALSRYQSALVLDPDNPDVYWGMAESEKHLGNFAEARANYEKVIEYDPGSKHAKEAKKTLDEPELANAKPAAAAARAPQ